MLGGNTDVIGVSASAMWGPTSANGGVLVHEAFCSEGCDGRFVVIEKTIDFFIGRLAGIMARETKEV